MKTQLPNSNEQTRNSIYEGDIYLVSGGSSSQKLIASMIEEMERELETDQIRKAHLQFSDSELFERIGKLRRHFYESPHYHDLLRNVIEENGFDQSRISFDPIRIRVVLPGGHNNPKAAPVYYAHRDTWYSHPESLIVWWMPLHDLDATETFRFYPDYFEKEVPNDSEIFNYDDWVKDGPALKIGWQKEDSGINGGYPQANMDTSGLEKVGFSCAAGDNLIFSGSQFHQTLCQDFDTIRFSLDFRIAHLDDVKENKGAPNIDNRSLGSTLKDYIQPYA